MSSRPAALVIEHDPAQRALIALALSRAGCQVVTATDGAEAFARLEAFAPRLVVLDTYLPQLNGLDWLRQARAEKRLGGAVVMIVSAFAFPEVVEQAVSNGAREFLVKPIDVDQLVARAKLYLSGPTP